jgi:hypothetical protein
MTKSLMISGPIAKATINAQYVKRTHWREPNILLDRFIVNMLATESKDEIMKRLYDAISEAELQSIKHVKAIKHEHFMYSLKCIPKVPVSGFVYFISGYNRLVKIGCSRNPESRLKKLEYQYGTKLEIEGTWQSSHMYYHEAKLHNIFSTRRVEGEWFDIQSWHVHLVNWMIKRGNING